MDYPQVTITDLSDCDSFPRGKRVNLGNAEAERGVNALLARLRESASKIFLLKWEGNKIPHGAIIQGKEIAWTQNGIVSSTAREQIGTYERLVEFGGETGNEQQMLVFVQ